MTFLLISLLLSTQMSPTGPIPSAVIVGRTVCRETTWLLVESRELVAIRGRGAVAVRPLIGLNSSENPWGLACLSDGSLWTLPDFDTLARLDDSGRLLERVPLQLRRTALFAAGDRLLFQQHPIVPGTPALMTSPPRQPYAVRAWPGLVVPRRATRDEQLTRTIVNCGIAAGAWLPCWFATGAQFTTSDGVANRIVDLAALRTGERSEAMPILDVALAPNDRFWLLAGRRDEGAARRSGVRLFRARVNGTEIESIDLHPAARIVLAASDTRCLLLAVDGTLIEVVATP